MLGINEPKKIMYLRNYERRIEIPLCIGVNEISADLTQNSGRSDLQTRPQVVLFKINIHSEEKAILRSFEEFPLVIKLKSNNYEEILLRKSGLKTINLNDCEEISFLNDKLKFGGFKLEKKSLYNNINNLIKTSQNEKNSNDNKIIDLCTNCSNSSNDDVKFENVSIKFI